MFFPLSSFVCVFALLACLRVCVINVTELDLIPVIFSYEFQEFEKGIEKNGFENSWNEKVIRYKSVFVLNFFSYQNQKQKQ